MSGRLLADLRALWQWLVDPWGMLAEDDAAYEADTIDLIHARHPSPRDCPTFDCAVCLARNDSRQVGRQASEGAAILGIARWLVANGFEDADHGERQQYACWLRRARADYEAGRYARV